MSAAVLDLAQTAFDAVGLRGDRHERRGERARDQITGELFSMGLLTATGGNISAMRVNQTGGTVSLLPNDWVEPLASIADFI